MDFETLEGIFAILGAGCAVCSLLVLLYCVVVELQDKITGKHPRWTDADIEALTQSRLNKARIAREIDEFFSTLDAR